MELESGGKVTVRKLNFTVLSGESVNASVWAEVSTLFSSEYGFYSQQAPFLAAAEWRVSGSSSIVDSRFFTDRSDAKSATAEVANRLGLLAEGEEWLAAVFRCQSPDDFSAYRNIVSASSDFVREAYRHMPQEEHAWASKTKSEVDRIHAAFPEIGSESVITEILLFARKVG